MMTRRQMLKVLGGLPLVGLPFTKAFASGFKEVDGPKLAASNLFDELGIEPLINARGTMTFLSGSLMRPEVVQAINSTSHQFANLHEVQNKIGERVAELLDCEAAMITAGAASAITLGTAAAITGTDKEKIKMLPDYPGERPEVIMQKEQRYVFDHAARLTGVKIVEVQSKREMENAINKNTVMALFFNAASSWYGKDHGGNISREDFVAICKKHNIPSFNDAAADVPPVENLFKYQRMGFDLVTFSGGKMIRGPQSTGILLGRKNLIEAAKLHFDPYECPIGRVQKVNKEEMFAMYVAVKTYLEMDHAKVHQEWINWINHIKNVVETVPGVTGKKTVNPGPANAFPGLAINWDQNKVKITPQELKKQLHEGTPRIEIGGGRNGLHVSVVTLKPTQVDIVAQQLKKRLQTNAA